MKKNRRGGTTGVVIGVIVGVSLCVFLGPCSGCKIIENAWKDITGQTPPTPPEPPRVVPCKEIVDDLRTLWSFERNYAYRNKSLATSITEMGDGTGIGKSGFVLSASLWEARIDDSNTNAVPATYRLQDEKTKRKQSVGAYRFGIVPALTSSDETDHFSVILFAVPEIATTDDFCFVALCGPVSLQNDFSFNKEWPVFQLRAGKEVVREVRGLKPTSLDKLAQRLINGDLKRYVNRTFHNLYYPEDVK